MQRYDIFEYDFVRFKNARAGRLLCWPVPDIRTALIKLRSQHNAMAKNPVLIVGNAHCLTLFLARECAADPEFVITLVPLK